MELIQLTPEFEVAEFDCGDSDLNDFLLRDAKHFLAKRIANTFLLVDNGRVAAYFCLLNDKISRLEIVNSQWKRIKDSFPDGKKFRSYPTIKIGRFAVSVDYRGKNIGTELMVLIKTLLNRSQNYSAFRFLTVDAYLSAIDFYRKNGFKELTKKDEDEHTRLMFFDMMDVE